MSTSRRRFGRLALPDGRRVFTQLEAGRALYLDRAPWHGGAPTGEALDHVDDEDFPAIAEIGTLRASVIAAP